MAAEKAYSDLPSNAAPAKKLQALKEWLIISLRELTSLSPHPLSHAPTPSDRVSSWQTRCSRPIASAW